LLTSDELRRRLRGGTAYARILRGEVRDTEDFSYPRIHDARLLTGCLRAKHTHLSRERFAATKGGTAEPVSRFFKLALDGLCHTLRAGTASDRGAFSAPRPIHPLYPRCISVREAARLHSYPDWFRFHATIWHGFRQIGNSVPPLLARAVARELIEALGYAPVKPRKKLSLGDAELAALNMREAAALFGVSPTVIPPRRRMNASG
jgi:DNA (cytosine-5)-methyltransferase 1